MSNNPWLGYKAVYRYVPAERGQLSNNPSASPWGPQQIDQDQWAHTSAAFLWTSRLSFNPLCETIHSRQDVHIPRGMTSN